MENKNVLSIHDEYHNSSIIEENFDWYCRNIWLKDFIKEWKWLKLLDLWCWAWLVWKFFLEKWYDVYWLEINEKAWNKAKERWLKVSIWNIEEKFPFEDDYFDYMFWGDNIEHLYYLENVMNNIKNVLKKDWKLILSTINYSNIVWRFKYLILWKIPISEAWNNSKNIWDWEHIRLWNHNDLINFVERYWFKLEKSVWSNNFKIFPKFLYKYFPKLFSWIVIYKFTKI